MYWCESIWNHAVLDKDVQLLHLIKKERKKYKDIKEGRKKEEEGREGKRRTGVPWI